MSKLVELNKEYWPQGGYAHWCPGCGYGHEINVDQPNGSGAKWTFNGNFERPGFQPSVNYRLNPPDSPHYNADVESAVCHYFLTDGRLHFLGDCTHALRGQVVELPDMPEGQYRSCRRC